MAGGDRHAGIAGYEDVRRRSRRRLPRAVFDMVDGGSGREITLGENRTAFERLRFNPRTLVDVRRCDTTTRVFGHEIALPVLLAPAGGAGIVHSDGERAVARAAAAAGTIYCVPTAANVALGEVVATAPGPLWFQVFLWDDEHALGHLVAQADRLGCTALVVTADVPYLGHHCRDIRNGATFPPRMTLRNVYDGLRHPGFARRYLSGDILRFANIEAATGRSADDAVWTAPGATWEGLARLRERWRKPLVLKGVLSSEDAKRAVDLGLDGIYVSNHGGRQLDGARPAVEVLPEVVAAVRGRAAVFLDSGVRDGADVVKARALGADACFIGRPWFHALAAGGQPMVEHMLELLRDDVARTLGLLGVPRFDDVGRSVVHDVVPASL